MYLWKKSERESRRVEGGSVYSIHVLFVNHSTGKRDTPLYSSQSTKGLKKGLVGGGGRVRDFMCMHVREQCVGAMESVSIRDIQKGQQGRMSRRAKDQRGREC